MRAKYLPIALLLILPASVLAQLQILNFKKLADYLPAGSFQSYIPGKATGETATMMGFATSWAQVVYSPSDDSAKGNITVKITDMLNLPSYMSLMGDVNETTGTGYERTVFYDGLKVLESYDSVAAQCKLQFQVANRFLVEINGTGVRGTSILYAFLGRTNIGGLVRLVRSKEGWSE